MLWRSVYEDCRREVLDKTAAEKFFCREVL